MPRLVAPLYLERLLPGDERPEFRHIAVTTNGLLSRLECLTGLVGRPARWFDGVLRAAKADALGDLVSLDGAPVTHLPYVERAELVHELDEAMSGRIEAAHKLWPSLPFAGDMKRTALETWDEAIFELRDLRAPLGAPGSRLRMPGVRRLGPAYALTGRLPIRARSVRLRRVD